jgi:HEAT repeat protein
MIQSRGAEGIKALGILAEPAIPALAQLFFTRQSSAFDVADALMATGPKGVEVVRNGLPNSNASIRTAAINVLSELGRTNSSLVAAFRNALTDSDFHVRRAATNALMELDLRTDVSAERVAENK